MLPPQPAWLRRGGSAAGNTWGTGSTLSCTTLVRGDRTLPFQVGATVSSSFLPSTTNVVNVSYYQSWARNSSGDGELGPCIGVVDKVALHRDFKGED